MSIYHLYRRLIELRKAHPALQLGSYRPIVATGDLLLYLRELEGDHVLVALNLGAEPTAVTFPADTMPGHVLLSTYCDRENEPISNDLALRVHEGVLIMLDR